MRDGGSNVDDFVCIEEHLDREAASANSEELYSTRRVINWLSQHSLPSQSDSKSKSLYTRCIHVCRRRLLAMLDSIMKSLMQASCIRYLW